MSTGVCVCACMHAEWEVQGGCLQVCAGVHVCVLSGRFRVPYWMSTGVCVCACMHAEWEVQGSVLDVYRCVRVCRYVC